MVQAVEECKANLKKKLEFYVTAVHVYRTDGILV